MCAGNRRVSAGLARLLPALAPASAFAGPEGGTVAAGTATISGQGTANVTVNPFSQNATVNWHTFNIGAGERTQFIQPNSSSVILNRVTGGQGPSPILGTTEANWGGGTPDKSLVANQSAVLDSKVIPRASTVTVDATTRIDASALSRR